MLKSTYTLKDQFKPKFAIRIEKGIKRLSEYKNRNSHNFKYFITGGLVIGGVILNNYESIFKSLHLSNSKMKRRLDNLFGKTHLDTTENFELPDDKILDTTDLSTKTFEEILQIRKNIQQEKESKSDRVTNQINIQKLNDSENELLKDLITNKKILHLDILELETKSFTQLNERDLIVNEIKKEYENQNRILNEIHSKLNSNEQEQWNELKSENESILKSFYVDIKNTEIFNDANNQNLSREAKNKELEIMRTYLGNYNTDLISSNQVIQKLNEKFQDLSTQIKNIEDETNVKNDQINQLRKIEEEYLIRKQNLTQNLINSQLEKVFK